MGILQMPNFHMCRCPKKGLFFVFFGHRANSLEGHERIGGKGRLTAALGFFWKNEEKGGHSSHGAKDSIQLCPMASPLLGAGLVNGKLHKYSVIPNSVRLKVVRY